MNFTEQVKSEIANTTYRTRDMKRLSGIVFVTTLLLTFLSSATAIEIDSNYKVATLAGGCFWCMEGPFDKIDGVISTTSGYTGGHKKDPTYRQVSSGNTGHTEAIQVVYDPTKVSFDELLKVFWVNVDPLTDNAQFCDHGTQYRSGIFYHDDKQKQAALKTRDDVKNKFKGKTVFTEVTKFSEFYPAEEYHQDYYKKNSVRYNYYRWRCGRDARLEELWGKDAKH